MRDAVNYTRWLVDTFRDYFGESVLEVGIGHGGYYRCFPPVARYLGLDVDPELIDQARRAHPQGEYLTASITDPALPERLQPYGIDTVLCCNVLEHIADDRAAVRIMIELLPPGGHLLLFVPALQALYTDLDRLAGHHRRYTRDQIRSLVDDRSTILRLDYFNPVGGLGWWLNRLLRHRSLEDQAVARQVLFFDRVLLPVSRLINPLTAKVFGQSVVCVARKR